MASCGGEEWSGRRRLKETRERVRASRRDQSKSKKEKISKKKRLRDEKSNLGGGARRRTGKRTMRQNRGFPHRAALSADAREGAGIKEKRGALA